MKKSFLTSLQIAMASVEPEPKRVKAAADAAVSLRQLPADVCKALSLFTRPTSYLNEITRKAIIVYNDRYHFEYRYVATIEPVTLSSYTLTVVAMFSARQVAKIWITKRRNEHDDLFFARLLDTAVDRLNQLNTHTLSNKFIVQFSQAQTKKNIAVVRKLFETMIHDQNTRPAGTSWRLYYRKFVEALEHSSIDNLPEYLTIDFQNAQQLHLSMCRRVSIPCFEHYVHEKGLPKLRLTKATSQRWRREYESFPLQWKNFLENIYLCDPREPLERLSEPLEEKA